MSNILEDSQNNGHTLRIAKYDTKNGLQMHLNFKNAKQYLDPVNMVQVVVIEDKIYFEPADSGNRVQKGRLMIIAKADVLKEFDGLIGEYPLYYDKDMDMLFINKTDTPITVTKQITYEKKAKTKTKKKNAKTEGKNMNMAGKKNSTSAKQAAAADLLKNLKPDTKPLNAVEKVALAASTKAPVVNTAEKSPQTTDTVKEEKAVVEAKTETKETVNPTTESDYKNTVINLMSEWTAELVKNKDFDAARKLIDITTEIDNL